MSARIRVMTENPLDDDLPRAFSALLDVVKFPTEEMYGSGESAPRMRLQRVVETDTIPKVFGARVGDIVRYRGPSETAGSYTTYRLVIRRALK